MQVVLLEKSESSLGSVGLCSLRPESTGELFDSLEDHVSADGLEESFFWTSFCTCQMEKKTS